ncbi:hypothetical protein MHYP_G00251190 [Metynnis hypsauchen]
MNQSRNKVAMKTVKNTRRSMVSEQYLNRICNEAKFKLHRPTSITSLCNLPRLRTVLEQDHGDDSDSDDALSELYFPSNDLLLNSHCISSFKSDKPFL